MIPTIAREHRIKASFTIPCPVDYAFGDVSLVLVGRSIDRRLSASALVGNA